MKFNKKQVWEPAELLVNPVTMIISAKITNLIKTPSTFVITNSKRRTLSLLISLLTLRLVNNRGLPIIDQDNNEKLPLSIMESAD